jgi:hypothetical protein
LETRGARRFDPQNLSFYHCNAERERDRERERERERERDRDFFEARN